MQFSDSCSASQSSIAFPGRALQLFSLACLFSLLPAGPASAQEQPSCPSLLDHRFNRLQDEKPQHLCQYSGKVVLTVNTASYCGFTSQYEGLEKLFSRYQKDGLVILGFPSNDFGQQEPGNSRQIADLCYNTYGVKFPMFAKTAVSGPQANPFYASLIRESGKAPRWNFHKYLIDRSGKVIGSYPSETSPDDRQLGIAIEKALAQTR